MAERTVRTRREWKAGAARGCWSAEGRVLRAGSGRREREVRRVLCIGRVLFERLRLVVGLLVDLLCKVEGSA